jgi:hypothetical protein
MSYYLELIKDAVGLDVHDLNYAYTPENFRHLLLTKAGLPGGGYFRRLVAFFWHMLKSFADLWPVQRLYLNEKDQTLIFATSKNQQAALQPLIDNLDQVVYVGVDAFGNKRFPLFFAYLISLFFAPLVLYRYLMASKEVRSSYYYALDLYWFAYGHYIVARWLFRRTQPRSFIVANDHILMTRALVFAARKENIRTIYIQHASVTERFPPLVFDYALLEGMDSLQKYITAGPCESSVFLVGMTRFDQHYHAINDNDTCRVVGLCTNLFETPEQVELLVAELSQELAALDYVLRPHPRDPRYDQWVALAQRYDLAFSDGRVESTFNFLEKVDAIVAGESNILLEAALLNVYPIYYDLEDKHLDWYGFHQSGLVDYFSEPEHVRNQLKALNTHKPDVRAKSHYYCATVDTAYDGRSTELTCQLIDGIVVSAESFGASWELLPTAGINNVYVLTRTTRNQVD